MKIAVSATGKDLDCKIDHRFGRCACFIVVETDDMGIVAFDNQNAALPGSAGIQSASFIASQDVQCVLTGSCGPKAAEVLSSAGIRVYTGQQGIVRDAIARFKDGPESVVSENDGDGSKPPGAQATASMPSRDATVYGSGKGMGGGMGMGGGRRCGGGGRRGGGGGRGKQSARKFS